MIPEWFWVFSQHLRRNYHPKCWAVVTKLMIILFPEKNQWNYWTRSGQQKRLFFCWTNKFWYEIYFCQSFEKQLRTCWLHFQHLSSWFFQPKNDILFPHAPSFGSRLKTNHLQNYVWGNPSGKDQKTIFWRKRSLEVIFQTKRERLCVLFLDFKTF